MSDFMRALDAEGARIREVVREQRRRALDGAEVLSATAEVNDADFMQFLERNADAVRLMPIWMQNAYRLTRHREES